MSVEGALRMTVWCVAWQSTLLGLAAAQYWRKDFKIQSHAHSLCLLALAAVQSLGSWQALLAVIAAVISADMLGALKKNFLMCVLVMLLSVTKPDSAWVAAVAVWVQMARRPLWLKLRLREPRIAFGPVYVIAASQVFSTHGGGLQSLGIGMVLVAGSVLRPDNTATAQMLVTLRLLPTRLLQDHCRTKCHGCLMSVSVLLLALLHLFHGHWLKALAFFGPLILEFHRKVAARH